jgi:hypothetical protein
MFREMRRKNQVLSREETMEILKRCTAGVLGVSGDDDYPYVVPLSFVFKDDKLFFHSAKQGHKLDGIKRNDKVTFCVIDKDEIVPKEFTTYFRSVIIFGRARILSDDAEKRYAFESLVEKYSPEYMEEGKLEIEKDWNASCLVEIQIEHITGKAAIELVRKKQKT